MTTDLPPLPVDDLLTELIGACSDYADGDHPGYFRHTYNAETGTLHVFYEHADPNDESVIEDCDGEDEGAPKHGESAYRFQLISEVSGEPGDWQRQIRGRYQDERDDWEDHLTAIRNVLREAIKDHKATDTELGAIARVLLTLDDDDS